MSQHFSLLELAGLLGVNRSTVTTWLGQGCPFVERADRAQGKEWKLSLPDVVGWLRKRDVDQAIGDTSKLDIDEARRRKIAAEAALAELELAKQRGEVVAISVVEDVVGEQLSACRARLIAWPTKCGPLVAPITDVTECTAILDRIMREAADELVGYATGIEGAEEPVEESGSPPDQGAAAPAAETDGQRVGRRKPKAVSGSKRRARPVDHGEE